MKKLIISVLLSILCFSTVICYAEEFNDAKGKQWSELEEFEYVVKNNEMVKKYLSEEEIELYRKIVLM